MNFGVAIPSDEAPDHRRLLFSLAGAVLIASLGFALVFLLFGSLPYVTLHLLSTQPPAKAAYTLKMMTFFARSIALFSGVFTSTILIAFVARKQRSKKRHPIKLTRKMFTEL
jgi:heme/copper-type cytochrome/quinol oxidase subunit 2